MSAAAEVQDPRGPVEIPSEVPSPYLEAAAVALRVAGVVVALAYLTGWLDGPLLAAVGGLALITYGHALLLARVPSLVAGAAFAVVVAALAVGALRWSTLELSDLRGVQAVLGPTVLVEKTGSSGPILAPVAAWIAAVAAAIAMAVWLRFPRGEAWFSLLPWAGELLVSALAVATVFWGPAATAMGTGGTGDVVAELGRWALVTGVVAAVAAALSYLLGHLPRLWTIAALAVATTAALSAVGMTARMVAV